MRSDPKQQSVRKPQIEWRGYGLLSSSRTLSPTALSLPVLYATGTMPCDPWPTYEETVYKRLEESVLEYMDEDMTDKFVPALKRALKTELTRRRQQVSDIEAIMTELSI
jgi:hypothetical protein